MKSAKRTAALLLAAGIVSTVAFGGCSNSTNSAKTKSSEPTQITAYFLAPKCTGLKAVNDKINQISKKDINVTVKLNYLDWDSYADKTKLMLQSGENFDLLFTAMWNNYSTFVSQGALKPLDDLYEKYGADIKKNIQDGYIDAAKINGKLYAIPTNKDFASVWGFAINKTLADKYHMDFSHFSKPEDILPYLETIKKNEPGITPIVQSPGNTVTQIVAGTYFANGSISASISVPKDGSTKVVDILADSRLKEGLDLARTIYTKGLTNRDAATCTNQSDYQRNQKAFCWISSLKPGLGDELSAQFGYPIIQVNGFGDTKKPTSSTEDYTSSMFSIPTSSTHPEAAMKFMNEMYASKEIQNLLAWGIEGVNYVKDSDGRVSYPKGVTSKTNTYAGIYQWTMGGNEFNDYVFNNEAADKWVKMKNFNKSAIKNPLIGFTFDKSSVQNEITALATVDKQYFDAITTGSVDYASTYQKYLAAEKKAGYDTVMKAVQSQVDKFLKSKKK